MDDRADYVFKLIVGVILSLGIVLLFVAGSFVALSVTLTIAGGLFLQALSYIPASPPHVALLTSFGERIPKVKKEGWRLFFLQPFVRSFIPIKVEKVDHDFSPQEVRTPDLASVEVPISITWMPDQESPERLIEYLNAGGESGVRGILENIVSERLRQWAYSQKEGPKDVKEVFKAGDDAVKVLLKRILGPAVPKLTKEIVEDMRKGNGKLAVPQLGIILNRLNIGAIKPLGEVATALETEAVEKAEQPGHLIQADTLALSAEKLKAAGYDQASAVRYAPVAIDKADPVKVSEVVVNLGSETLGALKDENIAKGIGTAAGIAGAIFGKPSDKKSGKSGKEGDKK